MRRFCSSVALLTLLSAPVARAGDSDATPDVPLVEEPSAHSLLQPHRAAYLASGLFLGAALTIGYTAKNQAERTATSADAAGLRARLRGAEAAAQAANLMYALAGASLAYGLLLEFLPEPAAEKASLTFHF